MEEGSPLISVIMPAFNCEKYIGQAIRSVLDQTYTNWELLISDDGSTDNTLSIIETFTDNRIKFLGSTNNTGAFTSKNYLLSKAQGEFVAFLDADDYTAPNRLEQQLFELKKNPSVGMIGCQIAYVDEMGKPLRFSSKPLSYEDVLNRMYNENVIGDAVVLIRKSSLDSVGGRYREYFNRLSYQDYDLSLLIAEKYPCYNLKQVLYYYRQHEDSTSKIINPDRLIARDVVIHLAQQRKQRGSDDLMDGKSHLVDAYFNQLRQPYLLDKSLVYREYAASYMYNKFYRKAIQTAWMGIKEKPFKLINWMTLQYCIRVSFKSTFID